MAELSSQGLNTNKDFLALPVDAISELCLFLSPKDAINLSRTCSALHPLIKQLHNVWRVYCKRVWLYSGPCSPGSSWYSEFLHWIDGWGQYMDCFADIKRAWDLVYLKFHQSDKNPDIIFRPGASERVLCDAETRLGYKLPTSYRCFLRIHNGQMGAKNSSLFGTELQFYHIKDEGSYLSPAEDLLQNLGLVCMTNHGRLQSYMLCVEPSSHSKAGEVKCHSKTTTGQLKSIKLHTCAPSFTDWFCKLGHQFQSYPVIDGVIMRFPYSSECIATTRGICIQVGTAFSDVYSRHIDDSLVIYHITISMSEHESGSLASQLITRHWSISDEKGAKEPIEGPGVVGYTPIISPGTVFTYTSGSHVERDWSLMEGYFTFVNQRTGETFQAKVPPFKLIVPPYTWVQLPI
ncbi:F-box only protein 3 [Oopsacas minuta]|uniref:F-box only protein 3 n=1 Tax=Oopsacas minuta TaxID=111878 RepID=A0AAV7K189_9METZ|nr:F-box only protein 3 [Oopsacas minuta]